jgi:hypothetical protein
MFSATGLLLATGMCVAAGLFELARSYRLVRVGKRTRARLLPGKPRAGDPDDGDPPLMLQFRTDDGALVEKREATRSKADDASIGTEVGVIYDPNDPNKARRDAFNQLWIPGLVWIAFGLILAVVALVQILVPSS